MNPSLYNAVWRIERKVETGDEDGTPIYESAVHDVPGWFDEHLASNFSLQTDRSRSVPVSLRRAVFGCAVSADLQERDEGEVFVGGLSLGRWSVESDKVIPIPGGASHRELLAQRITEAR